jgi:hypothetical protein
VSSAADDERDREGEDKATLTHCTLCQCVWQLCWGGQTWSRWTAHAGRAPGPRLGSLRPLNSAALCQLCSGLAVRHSCRRSHIAAADTLFSSHSTLLDCPSSDDSAQSSNPTLRCAALKRLIQAIAHIRAGTGFEYSTQISQPWVSKANSGIMISDYFKKPDYARWCTPPANDHAAGLICSVPDLPSLLSRLYCSSPGSLERSTDLETIRVAEPADGRPLSSTRSVSALVEQWCGERERHVGEEVMKSTPSLPVVMNATPLPLLAKVPVGSSHDALFQEGDYRISRHAKTSCQDGSQQTQR